MSEQRWRSKEYRRFVLETVEHHNEIVLFDTETTGLSAATSHIIELAAIKFRIAESGTLHETDRLHLYIRPAYPLPEEITQITGITDAQLADAPTEAECFPEIRAFFNGEPLIVSGHNVSFDTAFLSALFKRNGDSLELYAELDTLEMARDRVSREETPNYKLGTLAQLFGLDKGVHFHSAIEDVQVTAKLFELFYKEYRDMPDEEPTPACLLRPKVKRIAYWAGYRGFSRIYIETDNGAVYYDVQKKSWYPKDANMSHIDMEYLQTEVLRLTGCSSLVQFSRFTGCLTV